MSKFHMLRALVEQRLTLAAEDIFELFERTMAEYEEELCRRGKLLNAVFQPEVRLHRADVQQLMVNREAVPPEQQIWNPSLDQQNPPELPNIKEEQEELWTKQEEKQLQLLEEPDTTKFTFTPVKIEDEEEKPQTSQLHQSQTEELRDAEHLKSDSDEEHSGGSEAARNLNPDNHLETATNDKTSHSSEPKTDESYEMRDSESGLKPLQNNEVLLRDKETNIGEASVRSSERTASFGHKGRLQKQKHYEAQTGVSLFSCSVCGKGYHMKTSLRHHMKLHSATRSFSCSVCTKSYIWRHNLRTHMRSHTGEKPFSCSVCDKKYALSSSLTMHLRVHTGEKPISCSICGKKFARNGQLRRHVMTHTGEKPFSCSVCGKRFAQKTHMHRHMTIHTGEKPFSCSVCGKGFNRPYSFKRHKCVDVQQLMVNREAVPPEQQIWNPSLDQQNPPELPNIKEEQKELWTEQEEEQLQLLEEADIIKFTFTPVKSEDEEAKLQTQLHQSQTEELRNAEHLKSDSDEEHSGRSEAARNLNPDNHLETAANDKTSHFSEPETDDSYDREEMKDSESGLKPLQNNEVLLNDKEINTGKTSVSSSEREANFGHKGRLQKQKHNETKAGVTSFSCSICSKTFLWRHNLKTHMRIHTGEKPFSCPICCKKFARNSNLTLHLRVHTGEKPYGCSVCSKKFTNRSHLTLHLRVHTGEKPFSCSVCGKKFANNTALTYHLRVHTGEKPYQCSICKACFRFRSSLCKHIRMHSGEKPFSCSICGRKFADKWKLRRHVITHTGEKPFSCSVCGKRFARHGDLRRHSDVHTRETAFHCSICDKRFTRLDSLKKHKCVGDNSRNR